LFGPDSDVLTLTCNKNENTLINKDMILQNKDIKHLY